MPRELILSVRIEDCSVSTFRAGGPGGQNQNKVASAVRITHSPSGAVGMSRDDRSQHTNKRIAWRRLGQSKKFQEWAKLQAASELEVLDRIAQMERFIGRQNLKVEVLHGGHWEMLS